MAINLTGSSKTITLTTSTTFTALDIYNAMVTWSIIDTNMQYLIPMTSAGKAPFGGGAYSDLVFSVVNGWKILTSGYASTDIIKITGTMVCSTGDFADMIDSSSTGRLVFNPASFGSVTTVTTGSGVTSQDKTDIIDGVRTEMDANSTKLKQIKNGVNALQ